MKVFLSCPYLINLKPSDLKGPLVQFQAAVAEKKDTRRLIGTLNDALKEHALPEKQLEKSFEIWWPSLERLLGEILSKSTPPKRLRSDRELLEEILALVRDQARQNSPALTRAEFLERISKEGQNLSLQDVALVIPQHRSRSEISSQEFREFLDKKIEALYQSRGRPKKPK